MRILYNDCIIKEKRYSICLVLAGSVKGEIMDYTFDIIVPVYNASRTLDRMIASFLKQEYKNYRLILINDGSKDDSVSKCEQYAATYSNIVFQSQKNQGPGVARKTGFEIASAEYIMFCDADDYVEANLLSDINQSINENPSDIVEFGFRKVTLDGKELPYLQLKDEIIIDKCLEHYIKQVNTTNYLWNRTFRRELISLDDFIDLHYSEDACFLANIAKKASHQVIIGDIYYNYVISSTSACGSKINYRRLDMIKADQYIMGLLNEEYDYLRPYEAVTACSHAARLYGRFHAAGLLSTDIGMFFKKQFTENYILLRTSKKEVFQDASLKRRLSIMLFRFSPKMYTFLFALCD